MSLSNRIMERPLFKKDELNEHLMLLEILKTKIQTSKENNSWKNTALIVINSLMEIEKKWPLINPYFNLKMYSQASNLIITPVQEISESRRQLLKFNADHLQGEKVKIVIQNDKLFNEYSALIDNISSQLNSLNDLMDELKEAYPVLQSSFETLNAIKQDLRNAETALKKIQPTKKKIFKEEEILLKQQYWIAQRKINESFEQATSHPNYQREIFIELTPEIIAYYNKIGKEAPKSFIPDDAKFFNNRKKETLQNLDKNFSVLPASLNINNAENLFYHLESKVEYNSKLITKLSDPSFSSSYNEQKQQYPKLLQITDNFNQQIGVMIDNFDQIHSPAREEFVNQQQRNKNQSIYEKDSSTLYKANHNSSQTDITSLAQQTSSMKLSPPKTG